MTELQQKPELERGAEMATPLRVASGKTMPALMVRRHLYSPRWLTGYAVPFVLVAMLGVYKPKIGGLFLIVSACCRVWVSLWCAFHVSSVFSVLSRKKLLDEILQCPGAYVDMARPLKRYFLLVFAVACATTVCSEMVVFQALPDVLRGTMEADAAEAIYQIILAISDLLGVAAVSVCFWCTLGSPPLTAVLAPVLQLLCLFWSHVCLSIGWYGVPVLVGLVVLSALVLVAPAWIDKTTFVRRAVERASSRSVR